MGETILTGSMMYKDLTDGGEDKVITIEGNHAESSRWQQSPRPVLEHWC